MENFVWELRGEERWEFIDEVFNFKVTGEKKLVDLKFGFEAQLL